MYVYVDRDVSRQDLGTCENPEEAMKETQRALAILSGHVNVGIESVMSLEQYEDSKKLILNNNKYKRDEKRYNCIGIYINYKSIFCTSCFR
jgi:hypothetical protein